MGETCLGCGTRCGGSHVGPRVTALGARQGHIGGHGRVCLPLFPRRLARSKQFGPWYGTGAQRVTFRASFVRGETESSEETEGPRFQSSLYKPKLFCSNETSV